MKALLAATIMAVLLAGGFAFAHKPPKPPSDKDVRKFAAACALEAVGAGTTMDVETLGNYCVDLAKFLASADYELEPAP